MKQIFLTAIMAVLFTSVSLAQQSGKDALFGSNYPPFNALSAQAKFSILNAFGGTGKSVNETIINQTGNQNTMRLELAGTGNNVTTKQEGSENYLSMEMKGADNLYLLEQNGNSNTLVMNSITSNNVHFQAIQTNDGNSLTLEGNGIGSLQSMKIEQTGGMSIIISSLPSLGL
jgi:hypothetical protein